MGDFFSKPKKKKAELSDKDNAVLKLKISRDRLAKFKVRNEFEEEVFKKKAKKFLSDDRRDLAKLAIKSKMLKTREIMKVEGQIMKVQEMISQIEIKVIEKSVFESLEAALDAMNKLNSLLPVDKIEEILSQIEEQKENLSEVQTLLSQNMDPVDESELLNEYDSLLSEVMPQSNKVQLPEVPTHEPEVKATINQEETQEKMPEAQPLPA